MLMTRNEMSICYLGAYMSAMLNVLYCVMDLSAKVNHPPFLEYQVKCLFYSGCLFRCYSYAAMLPLPFWLWIEIAALVTKTSPVVALQHLVILSFVQSLKQISRIVHPEDEARCDHKLKLLEEEDSRVDFPNTCEIQGAVVKCLPTHMPPNIASSHQKVKWELEAPEKADIAEMASQTSPVLPLFRLKVALMISYALESMAGVTRTENLLKSSRKANGLVSITIKASNGIKKLVDCGHSLGC
ncbi:uncharacterized protein A4U43_C03F540 [Asparagus officinalis]|uniref:Uncharacterized protein n=1 Tax=Asparagus officinalis TaxID=4686 RepID=A0A5P1F6S6_ASPOF|nr:uncharacterized protein A4U43_C03F540 [Asparagus officinalis]